jgi:hypothetical protein
VCLELEELYSVCLELEESLGTDFIMTNFSQNMSQLISVNNRQIEVALSDIIAVKTGFHLHSVVIQTQQNA